MDCGVPFCHTGCPLGNLIPDWNDLVERGRWREALRAARRHQQLPGVHRQALPGAVRGGVRARAQRRRRSRSSRSRWRSPSARSPRAGSCRGRRPPRAGGAWPSSARAPPGSPRRSSSAAPGHAVTVLERDDRPGGLLRYGIPDFKTREEHWSTAGVAQLEAEGIVFRCGETVCATWPQRCAPSTTRWSWPPARSGTATSTLPGRELDGVELAMPYLIACNRRGGEARRARRSSAGGQRVVDPRRRRHQRRLPRLGAPREAARRWSRSRTASSRRPSASPLATWPRWPRLQRSYAAHLEGGDRRYAFETVEFVGRDGRVAGAPRCGRRTRSRSTSC